MKNSEQHIVSPVAVFGFKRPEHTAKVLHALSECELFNETEVFLFCDGPKEDFTDADYNDLNAVRDLFRSFKGCLKTHLYISEKNLGLNRSIERGIDEVFKNHSRIIVLEDDIVVAKSFLKYMNSALTLFETSKKVFHISGFTPNMNVEKSKPDFFFMRNAQVWGWATWSDRWKHYYRDPKENYHIISKSKKDISDYNFSGSINYFELLKKTINGDQTIWDTKWSSSVFVLKGLALYSVKSLAINIGLDNSGVHCNSTSELYFQPNAFDFSNEAPVLSLEEVPEENKYFRKKIQLALAKPQGRKVYYSTLIKSFLNGS